MILNKSANFDFKQTTVSIPQIGMIIYVILQSLFSLAQKRFNPYLWDFGNAKERHLCLSEMALGIHKNVTNIEILSPSILSRQHHCGPLAK